MGEAVESSATLPSAVTLLGNLAADLSSMYLDEMYSDLRIIVQGKTFHCHKILLCARSKYFKDELHRCKEMNEMVEQDGSQEAFRLVLRYIYSGEIVCDDSDEELILDILSLAVKYQLDEIIDLMCDVMKPRVTAENVLKIAELISELKDHAIVEHCLQYISTIAEQILKSEDFAQLNMKTVVYLLKHLDVSREMKRDAASNWIKMQSDVVNLLQILDDEELRELLACDEMFVVFQR